MLYPHTIVNMAISSTDEPHLDVRDDHLFGKFFGDIKINALRKNQNPAYLLTLSSVSFFRIDL